MDGNGLGYSDIILQILFSVCVSDDLCSSIPSVYPSIGASRRSILTGVYTRECNKLELEKDKKCTKGSTTGIK